VAVGGTEEAWLFREEHLGLWQRSGAIDWLRRWAPARCD
jgi:hypothetical protein